MPFRSLLSIARSPLAACRLIGPYRRSRCGRRAIGMPLAGETIGPQRSTRSPTTTLSRSAAAAGGTFPKLTVRVRFPSPAPTQILGRSSAQAIHLAVARGAAKLRVDVYALNED